MDSYEKKYNELVGKIEKAYLYAQTDSTKAVLEEIRPELKESEDEKIRKGIIELVKQSSEILDRKNQERMLDWLEKQAPKSKTTIDKAIEEEVDAWLEKQSDTNETINNDELAQSVLRGAAINLITWIDYNAAEGNMCLSNVQCKEIENALVRGDWNKIYAYMKKKLEKQGEQKPADRLDPLIDEEIDLWIKENSDIHHDNNDIVKLMRDMACYVATLTRNLYRQKSKWSYEDEANLNNIIWLCNNCLNGEETTWIPSQAEKIKHLIETIKERGLT